MFGHIWLFFTILYWSLTVMLWISQARIWSDYGVVLAKQSRKGRTVPELIEHTKLMLGFTPSRY